MIIQWSHDSVAVGARGMTLNYLKQKSMSFVNANATVSHHKYVICLKQRRKIGYQNIADLSQERCAATAQFTYCGADMFKLLIINEIKSELNRYGAFFTCFSSRALHIEIANFLDDNSVILGFRTFMARGGAVLSIYSDNGTNFVSARNIVSVSHMGGIWELQIQSARIILEGLLKTHSHYLHDESLRSLMATSNLLIMKTNVILPPSGEFSKPDA